MGMPLDFVPSWFALVIHFLVDMILLSYTGVETDFFFSCLVKGTFKNSVIPVMSYLFYSGIL